jgi:hypothetical protein
MEIRVDIVSITFTPSPVKVDGSIKSLMSAPARILRHCGGRLLPRDPQTLRLIGPESVMPMNGFLDKFPSSVEKAVDKLAADMTFADRTRIANMSEAALIAFHQSYGRFLRTEFRLPGNDPLMQSCMSAGYLKTITPEQASYVILKELQIRLLAGHTLRVIK